MTTVHIEVSTREGLWLLDLIKDHKSVTVEPEKKEAKTVGAWGAALAAGAVPLEEFNARFDAKIQEAYKQ